MAALLVAVVACLAACVSSAVIDRQESRIIPKLFQTCPRDDINVDTCILNSLKKFHPNLIRGIPAFDLPPMDPFVLDESLFEYHNGQIHAKMGVKDYSLYGLRDLQYQGVRTDFSDPNNIRLEIDVYIPRVKSDGKYKLQGRFIKSDFGGKGIFNLTMSDFKTTWIFTGAQEVIDGITYLRIKNLDTEPEIGDMKIYASNLFSGNEALSRTALKLFNQNWRPVYKELLPYAKKDLDKIMTDLANRLFLRVPLEDIFPLSSPSANDSAFSF